MRLELLLLLAGALAVPDPPLPPLLHLLGGGEEEEEEAGAPPRLLCLAPRRFPGGTFQLVPVGSGAPVRNVSAAPDQHKAEFTLERTPRCYRCRYRSSNGSAWSPFSAEVAVNVPSDADCHPPASTGTEQPLPTSTTLRQDRSWLLPVAVSAAGVGLLLLLAAAAAAAWRGRRRRAGWSRGAPAPSFAMVPAAGAAA